MTYYKKLLHILEFFYPSLVISTTCFQLLFCEFNICFKRRLIIFRFLCHKLNMNKITKGGHIMKICNILVIGGDERYITVIEDLSKQGHHTHVIGFDNVVFSNQVKHHSDLSDIPVEKLHAIILPISGVTSTGHVTLHFQSHSIYLSQTFIAKTPHTCKLFTGVMTPYLEKISSQMDRKVYPIFNEHDVAIYNSIPTAEGALQIALTNTKKTIHGSLVLVLGFGRVGMTTARLFNQVGAYVTVAARQKSHFARIEEMRLTPMNIHNLTSVNTFDLFINTVPHQILTKHVINNMKENSLIIDLASAPGGCDFEAAKKLNIQALLALGLPGKVAPITAGHIIAKAIINILA